MAISYQHLKQRPFEPVRQHYGERDTHTCYQGTRETLHDWGYGCGTCPACDLRARGWHQWQAQRETAN